MNDFIQGAQENKVAYQKLVQSIRDTVGRELTDAEAHEAARNVIGFFKTLLEIRAHLNHNTGYDKGD